MRLSACPSRGVTRETGARSKPVAQNSVTRVLVVEDDKEAVLNYFRIDMYVIKITGGNENSK